jgi:spermidine synthase
LLQSWFSHTTHRRARDPYFLYAASNFGSLLALLSYPLLLEPSLKLREQSLLWAGCYVLGFVLIVICAIVFLAGRTTPAPAQEKEQAADVPLSWSRRLRWLALAFVPSSLMLGVTTYLSTDLTPVPLLWVVPLSLYLLTFILQFSGRQANIRVWGRFLLPLLTLPVVFSLACGISQPLWFFIPAHLAFFFAACMVCHGQLANDRPSSQHLTEFYLWLSAGGALGGLFNAILAPVIFRSVVEYPLMIVLGCLMRPWKTEELRRRDFAGPLAILLLLCAIVLTLERFNAHWRLYLILFTVSLVTAYLLVERPVRFGLAILAVLVGGTLYTPELATTLHAERNFFGVLRVMRDGSGTVRFLLHGTTQHGREYIDELRRCEPLSYYHRAGPFGSITSALAGQTSARVAVVGLGAGATASYGVSGQEWTFYEIDPAVVRIARDSGYFSYIRDCSSAAINFVVGDGRLRLKEAPDNYYSLIALDAFSSDAIPLHLLTRDAVGVYLSKLANGGLLAFHISNRHLDLSPVLGSIAKSYGLTALIMRDGRVVAEGKDASIWVVLARSPEDLKPLTVNDRWETLEPPDNFRVWTDDFSNIFSVLWR